MFSNIRNIAASLAAIAAVGIVPSAAMAQGWRHHEEAQNRQKTKNQWRNLATLGGAATAYGLLKGDKTVTFAGAAGALYSLNRYEQDRKSQSNMDRARASIFSRSSFNRDGHRYDRQLVTRNGQKYYYFKRH